MKHAPILLLGLLVLGSLAACSDDPSEPFALAPCALADAMTPALAGGSLFTLAELEPALRDAAARLVLALPESDLRTEMEDVLVSLSGAPASADTSCRLFLLGDVALVRLDRMDHPYSLPDRAALRLTLQLARAALEAS